VDYLQPRQEAGENEYLIQAVIKATQYYGGP